jgi:hypothetical protein
MSWHSLIHALDPVEWVRSLTWEPDHWQREALESTSRRLILNAGRQMGKSTVTASIALHTALYTPSSVSLVISPSQRQSGETFGKVLDFLSRIPDRPDLIQESATQLKLANKSRVIALPGSGDSIRTYSAHLIVLDEAARIPDEIVRAVTPMLATTGGRMIALSTPGIKSGFFWREWTHGKRWHRIKATADDCPRISAEFLADEADWMTPQQYRAEYYGEFIDVDDEQWLSTDLIDSLTDPTVKPLWPRILEPA